VQIQVLRQTRSSFGVPVRRSMRAIVAAGAAVALLTVLAATSTMAAELRTFTAVKTCSGPLPTTPVTQTCVINPSSLKILRGGTVHYTDIVFYSSTGAVVPPSLATHISSPVLFTAIDRRHSTASGRCTFFFAGPNAGTGHCEWDGGTGRLEGFHARWLVGTLGAHTFSLQGTFWFDRDHQGDGDRGSD